MGGCGGAAEGFDDVVASSSSSLSWIATRFMAALLFFFCASDKSLRAFSVNRTSSASLEAPFDCSISAARVRSRSANAAAPVSPASSRQHPLRKSALKCVPSIFNAASQSPIASLHRFSFMYAAARLANAAATVGSSATLTSYDSIADLYSLALNSSFPFSFSRTACHCFSFFGALRSALNIFSTSFLDAPWTDKSVSFDLSCLAASANTPCIPVPSSCASAALRSARVGMPSISE